MESNPNHFSPGMNNGTNIFVFGSNLAGLHGKGAAKEAALHWGAEYGVGEGPTGQAYAIPTKGNTLRPLAIYIIQIAIEQFLNYAYALPTKTFLVTRIGCGQAGFKDEQIAPFFTNVPSNVKLPKEWDEIRKEQ